MRRRLFVTALLCLAVYFTVASAQTIGVSWSNFQEERWRTDEAAIIAAIEEQ